MGLIALYLFKSISLVVDKFALIKSFKIFFGLIFKPNYLVFNAVWIFWILIINMIIILLLENL